MIPVIRCPAEVAALIKDCGSIDVTHRPDMKEIVERLRQLDDLEAS